MNLSNLGNNLLALAYPACLYSLLIYWIGHKKRDARLVTSAARANGVTFVLITLACITLIAAFLTNDYSIFYVYNYSNKSLPLFFKITGLWAGLDGSILFWTWLVSLYAMMVLRHNIKKNADMMPYINAVMMTIIFFFLSLVLFANNPFTVSPQVFTDGKGLNPLLQNIAMVVHPPSQYLGFTGASVPFAFAIAALVTRRLDAGWIDDTRRWTLIAWFFMTLGLILGGAWAYVELGWGGFWAWDPVENAALMPWLVSTAYIHSVMVQKKRGMLYVWNISLVSLTFFLTIFGTYLTRSGVVQSVHAFSEGNLGPYFLIFLFTFIGITAILVATRYKKLKSENVLHSFFSKEAAFILNNIVLVAGVTAVIWGTLFPTISEGITGERITVGIPFFNKFMAPIGLILLFLMGVGPMVSWKQARMRHIRDNLLIPGLFGIAVTVVTLFWQTNWYVVSSFGLVAFVMATIWLEFYRGVKVVRLQQKLGLFESFIHLFIQANRRYGGYVVHVGALFIFLGIAGTVLKTEKDFSLLPQQSVTFEGYELHYVAPETKQDAHHVEDYAIVQVLKNGKLLKTLMPGRFFYFTSEQPSTEVSVYQTLFHDLYLVIGVQDPQTGKTEFRASLNPLISFVWMGGFIILVGIVIVIFPKFKTPKALPLIILCVFLHSYPLHADESHQHVVNQDDPFANVSETDPYYKPLQELAAKLICQCGGCVRMDLKTCTCDYAKKEKMGFYEKLKNGMTSEAVIGEYVGRYGVIALNEPPKKGFLALGPIMPFIIVGAALVAGIAFITKKSASAVKPEKVSSFIVDDNLKKKIEDDLNNF
ncbi:cytochrome c biogenesis protein CcsA [bacterium]|nr:cytochrome c biogenesis protein CcsA [bacterium]